MKSMQGFTKLTNDTAYKTEKAFMEIKADAMLMGKGKMAILMKERIFDSNNAFSLEGTLQIWKPMS